MVSPGTKTQSIHQWYQIKINIVTHNSVAIVIISHSQV